MRYYENYLNSIAQDPRRKPKNDVEAMIRSQWKSSSLWAEIKEQDCIGTMSFHTVEVWKNTVSEFTSNIIKDEKDFRRLMFYDVDKQCERGRYYSFDSSYWLVYEGIQSESVYPEVLVRRCNNIAKWIDVETGTIIEQPCVLEYDLGATNPKINKDVIVANSSTTLVIQGNQFTHRLKRNARFIFNGVPYKIAGINNYLQNDYINKDTTILFFDIDFDAEKPTDDMVNNIADCFEHHFEVIIHEDPQSQVQGSDGRVSATILYNGEEVVDKYPVWSGNEFVAIDGDGCYTLLGEPGDVAVIKATFGEYSDCISIEITERPTNECEIVVTPMVFELYEQDTVRFEAYLYIDGEIQEFVDIDLEVSGNVDENCYILEQKGHSFYLTNCHYSKCPLLINFITEKAEKQLSIKLKSLF